MKNIVSIIAVVAATASGASAATITATGDLDKPKWNGSISLDAIPITVSLHTTMIQTAAQWTMTLIQVYGLQLQTQRL